MKRMAILSAGAGLMLIALLLYSRENNLPPSGGTLTVYCSETLRKPIELATAEFFSEYEVEVDLVFGTKGSLATHIKDTEKGDLLLALNDGAIKQASDAALTREVLPLTQSPSMAASAAVLSACGKPAAALRLARYLAAPSKGGRLFEAEGLNPAEGDPWVETPELILFSGGVNRSAIDALLREFSDREGVTVTTVFNGCGILCATMKTMVDAEDPKFPDAYYACDLCFVPPVAEFFPESVLLTETDIGIVVKLGNPHKVHTLADLARPGLRVGLCNSEQSTLGYMTRGMLKSSGLLNSVMKNVSVEVPTADFLVNQMRVGGLDAAIVYRVNATIETADLEFLPIKHAGAKAVQPFSVRGDSPNRQLASRLLKFLQQRQKSFEDAGFIWRGGEESLPSKDIEVPDWLKEE